MKSNTCPLMAGFRRFRTRHRHMDVGAVSVGHRLLAFGHVRPIDRETRDDFPDRVCQVVQRKVAGPPVPLRDAVELVAEHVDLTRHRDAHDQLLAVIDQIGVVVLTGR